MSESAIISRDFLLLLTAMLGAIFVALPNLTRPGVFFAVTVDPALRSLPSGKGVLRVYRGVVAVATLVALVTVLSLGAKGQESLLVWPLMGLVGVVLLAFLWCRKRVIPHAIPASSTREATLEPRLLSLPGGPIAQFLPFAAMVATAGWMFLKWEEIPDSIPAYWKAIGRAELMVPRSPSTVFGPLVSGMVTALLMLVFAFGLLLWSRRVAARGAGAAQESRFRRLVLLILLGAEYLIAVTSCLVAVRPFLAPSAGSWMGPSVLGLSICFVLVILIALVRSGQGGSRLPVSDEGAPQPGPVGDGTDDRYWKGGLIYFNPNDSSVLVEKRFGIGYTLNFGNMWSWVIIAALIGLMILPLLLR